MLGLSGYRQIGKTGHVAILPAESGARRLGIWADKDALPTQENSAKDWASCTQERFHGCGHGGHTKYRCAPHNTYLAPGGSAVRSSLFSTGRRSINRRAQNDRRRFV